MLTNNMPETVYLMAICDKTRLATTVRVKQGEKGNYYYMGKDELDSAHNKLCPLNQCVGNLRFMSSDYYVDIIFVDHKVGACFVLDKKPNDA